MTGGDDLQRLIETMFVDSLNMSFPLQGRKWLALLEEDRCFGLRIRPNLDLDRTHLGFTFSSNHLGLRGPCATAGPGVIFGTSYAMGFAVDNGLNWYDAAVFNAQFLNLGLPVGLRQMREMLDQYYTGRGDVAVFLYHPNIWTFCVDFARWQESSQPLFSFMRWQTNLETALEKSLAKVRATSLTRVEGQIIEMIDGQPYLLNPGYAPFNPDKFAGSYAEATGDLQRICRRFKKFAVIRIPMKEELASKLTGLEALGRLTENHLAGWAHFKAEIGRAKPDAVFYDDLPLTLAHYHPCDTHWNADGNACFQNYLLSHPISELWPETEG
ncbi:MAG: hypothetical protein NVV72_12225 [Asticcacaulis sp.]|nr:hypothetical protein [Asticcacaulis sp.]